MPFSFRAKPDKLLKNIHRRYSIPKPNEDKSITANNVKYSVDNYTNVTPKILSFLGKNLHNKQYHPLNLIKQRIVNYFYTTYVGRTGNAIFSVYDHLNAVVSVEQNFESLLIPQDHVSRKKSDCFYINRNYLLRAHMTAHQSELIKMGLDNFLMFGDVYRRDEIDSTHYPVFHQCDAVRLFHKEQLADLTQAEVFENGTENEDKQGQHTLVASREVEQQLKMTLESLARYIFGKAGAANQLGWAFGLGLDRLAMILYSIPDIRLLWSEDPGFLVQFHCKTPEDKITYKAVSVYPPCKADLSFWIPQNYEENDFHSLVRDIGGHLVEQVILIDKFTNPKTGKSSRCYRIVYRDLEKTLTQEEVNETHKKISDAAEKTLLVNVR